MVCSVLNTNSYCTTILLCWSVHSFLNCYHYPCQVLRMACHHCLEMTDKVSSHHRRFPCMLQDEACTWPSHSLKRNSHKWHEPFFPYYPPYLSWVRHDEYQRWDSGYSHFPARTPTSSSQTHFCIPPNFYWSFPVHFSSSGTRSTVHCACHSRLGRASYIQGQ